MSYAATVVSQETVPPEKVMIFIDGQNLMFACGNFSRKSGMGKRFRYDNSKLEQMLVNLRPNRKLVQVRYYTAVAQVDGNRQNDERRFQNQMNALSVLQSQNKWYVFYEIVKAYPVTCPYCRKEGRELVAICPECKREISKPKNKCVDVALATDMQLYALHSKYTYDIAIIVTGDTDFVPAIDSIKTHRPEVKIEVAQFKESVGDQLRLSRNVDFYDLDSRINQFGSFV